ncbi:hypothetical protein PFICI_13526 [Pestalotiopsis fici W106-1]|uniref:Uncharacterized protein n=1 Tax=Pestalotiopsis fici (strain W106-1 / CGMCC3.15140) TaxID=1229662 RepID=W3WPG1_PESFW|nr:uncharacterized protein PFICI_13526 [Pestalotiopsis fici W106-1]ETS75042.1 hypothetical protein PFICI_13526 [Pestalotiopsis fici W106-1]
MAWINIISIILPASCLISLAVLLHTQQSVITNDYELVPDLSNSPEIPAPEVWALLADTALTMALFVKGHGGYKSWSALAGSVLPEIYLVVLLAARFWVGGQSPFWADHLRLHAAALYAGRFCCGFVASIYSAYMLPISNMSWLGPARILLLGTLVWSQPLFKLVA